MKLFQFDFRQKIGLTVAVTLTATAENARAREENYNPDAAGSASEQGLENANCNSALILTPCEEISAEIIAEAEASMFAQPVPEPGVFALMFVAVAIVLFAKRWRPKPGIQGA